MRLLFSVKGIFFLLKLACLLSFIGVFYIALSQILCETRTNIISQNISNTPNRPLNVIWRASFESGPESRGFIEESINFLVPLSKLSENLGWWPGSTMSDLQTNQFFLDAKVIDQKDLVRLFNKGAKVMNEILSNDVISVVFEQPSQYKNIFENTRLKYSIYKIGRAMFETNWIPNKWEYYINEYLDELWVPSQFAKEVFESAGIHRPIYVINEGFDSKMLDVKMPKLDKIYWRKKLFPRCRATDLIFFSVGKMERRKGIDILVNSFEDEFDHFDRVCLYIRTTMTRPQKKSVEKLNLKGKRIYDLSHLSKIELIAAYKAADVFALITHGEGWGRPLMEAMASGLPAITTYWSGQTAFVHPNYTIPIKVTQLEPAYKGESWAIGGNRYQPLHNWAYIDSKNVRESLRWCDENREELPLIGERAKKAMYERFTREEVATTVQLRLQQITEMIQDKGVDHFRQKTENYNKLHDLEQQKEQIDSILSRISTVNHIDMTLTGMLKSIDRLHEKVNKVQKLANEVYYRTYDDDDDSQDSDSEKEGLFLDKNEEPPDVENVEKSDISFDDKIHSNKDSEKEALNQNNAVKSEEVTKAEQNAVDNKIDEQVKATMQPIG